MTTIAVVQEPELDRLRRELGLAEVRECELGEELRRLEAELPTAREALTRLRAELGERMRAGASAKELKPLKADESQAALKVEASEAFVTGRREALHDARRTVQKAKEALQSGNQVVAAVRAQLRTQQERVDRGRRRIAEDEASIGQRRRLLAGEESSLSAIRAELVRLNGTE